MSTLKNLYCLVGPSGSGKSTLEKLLCEKHGLRPVVSHTTRPMRAGEEDGRNHYFVSEDDFRLVKDEMVAYTRFNGYEYGTTRPALDRSDLYVIDLDGLDGLDRKYRDRRVIILGLDPGYCECAARMKSRGDSEELIETRLEYDWDAFETLPGWANVMLDASLPPEKLAVQAWAVIMGYENDFSDPE